MSLRLGALLPVVLAAAVLFGCGGGSESPFDQAGLSPSPGGTPPIFQRSPVIGTPRGSPGASPGGATPEATPGTEATPPVGVDVTPVEPFQVTVSEAINVRDRPSIGSDSIVLRGLYPGEKAKVIGEAQGQEVEPGKGDTWYQIELTVNGTTVVGFVYAPFVQKME